MQIEFRRVDDFKMSNDILQNGDYIYEHFSTEYPVRNEADLANLYFVTKILNNSGNCTIMSMLGNKEIDINVNELDDNWWIMKMPLIMRKSLGLD